MMGTAKSQKKTIRFKCSKCDATLRVGAKLAGRYIDCPKCKLRTAVPASQDEADADSINYTVNEVMVEVPPNCVSCGKKMPKKAVFCTRCGYDYRDGKKREGVREEVRERWDPFAWTKDVDFGKIAKVGILGGIAIVILGGVGTFIWMRQSGGGIDHIRYELIDHMYAERNIKATFGSPRHRIQMISADLGGGVFSLTDPADVERLKAAGVDVEQHKKRGFDMVTDFKADNNYFLMIGQPNFAYMLFYANSSASMVVVLEGSNVGVEEDCRMAAYLQANDDGSYTIDCHGMGPAYNARGDKTGFYWTQMFHKQTVRPDSPKPDLTFDPTACWKLWEKGKLRNFRK